MSPEMARAAQRALEPAGPTERPPDDYDRVRSGSIWRMHPIEWLILTWVLGAVVGVLLALWAASDL